MSKMKIILFCDILITLKLLKYYNGILEPLIFQVMKIKQNYMCKGVIVMIHRIKVNMEVIEAMLYFWQAASEKEQVSEMFFYDVAAMPGLSLTYDDEFNAESVRRVLSAIKNREIFSNTNKKERRFWNNNMWMMEDLEYTRLMVQPLKRLNLDYMIEKLNKSDIDAKYEEIEVFFSPLHMDDYVIKNNKLIINFFKVKPSDFDDNTYIGDTVLNEYIETKIMELLK
jgi:hypothetical protein